MKIKYPQAIEKSCFESIVELLKEDKIKEALDFLSSKIHASETLSMESKSIIIKVENSFLGKHPSVVVVSILY